MTWQRKTYAERQAEWAARSKEPPNPRALAAAWIGFHGPSCLLHAPKDLHPHIIALLNEQEDTNETETDE